LRVADGGDRRQKIEYRRQNTEGRIQKSEYRRQNTEVRIQKAEYRSQNFRAISDPDFRTLNDFFKGESPELPSSDFCLLNSVFCADLFADGEE